MKRADLDEQKRLLEILKNNKNSYLGMGSPAGFTPISVKEFKEDFIDFLNVFYGVYSEDGKLIS